MSRLRAVRTLEVLAAVVGSAVLLSCSSPPQAAPPATLSPAAETAAHSPSPSATEEPIDTARVPGEIDAEYVQAVMDDLDAAIGQVFRDARDAGKYGEAWHAAMRSLYTPEAVPQQTEAFESHGFGKLRREPADPRTWIEELKEATPSCVFFTGVREISPLFRKPIDPVQPYYMVLGRHEPDDVNPTAWLIAFESYFPKGGAPQTICDGEGA